MWVFFFVFFFSWVLPHNGYQLNTTLTGHEDAVICVTSNNTDILISGSQDKTLKVWNIHTGGCITTLTGHTGTIWCCVLSLDSNVIYSGSADNTIKIWDRTNGTIPWPYTMSSFFLFSLKIIIK